MNRRDVLRAIALGGGVVAGELWIPGQRVISIPKKIYTPQDTILWTYHYDGDCNVWVSHLVDGHWSAPTMLGPI